MKIFDTAHADLRHMSGPCWREAPAEVALAVPLLGTVALRQAQDGEMEALNRWANFVVDRGPCTMLHALTGMILSTSAVLKKATGVTDSTVVLLPVDADGNPLDETTMSAPDKWAREFMSDILREDGEHAVRAFNALSAGGVQEGEPVSAHDLGVIIGHIAAASLMVLRASEDPQQYGITEL